MVWLDSLGRPSDRNYSDVLQASRKVFFFFLFFLRFLFLLFLLFYLFWGGCLTKMSLCIVESLILIMLSFYNEGEFVLTSLVLCVCLPVGGVLKLFSNGTVALNMVQMYAGRMNRKYFYMPSIYILIFCIT